jgi:hypothetical protein
MLLLLPPSRCDPGKKTKGPKEGKKAKTRRISCATFASIKQKVNPFHKQQQS